MRSLVITVAGFLAACGSGSGSESVSNSPAQTVSSITLTPSAASIQVSQARQFSATATDITGNPIPGVIFTWASSNQGAATISNSGLATGVSVDSTTITATSGTVTSNQATLTVTTASIGTRAYSTTFPLAENPISEGSNWLNGGANGRNWSNFRTTSGFAYGTQTGSGGFNDSIAVLTGTWRANQSGEGVVKTINQQTGGIYEEVEIVLRGTITSGNLSGYECNFRATSNMSDAYAQIVRWNGPFGNFIYLSSNSSPVALHDGDRVKCTISGASPATITSYINGVKVAQGTDGTFTTGNPGMGHFLQGGTSAVDTDFGFASYTASDGP